MRTQRSVSKERARVCVSGKSEKPYKVLSYLLKIKGREKKTRKTMKNIFFLNYDIHRFGSRKKKNRRHTIKKAHGIMAER
jgi:hypothetical protein